MGANGKFNALASLPPGKIPGTHCEGVLVSPGACLDTFEEEKSHVPAGIRNPEFPAPSEPLNRFSCLVTHNF